MEEDLPIWRCHALHRMSRMEEGGVDTGRWKRKGVEDGEVEESKGDNGEKGTRFLLEGAVSLSRIPRFLRR